MKKYTGELITVHEKISKNIVYLLVANLLYSYLYPFSLMKNFCTGLSYYIHLLPEKVKAGGKEFLIMTIKPEFQNRNYFTSVT